MQTRQSKFDVLDERTGHSYRLIERSDGRASLHGGQGHAAVFPSVSAALTTAQRWLAEGRAA